MKKRPRGGPKKFKTNAERQAALDLVRPLQFRTRAEYDAYLVRREEERRELREMGVNEAEADHISGEIGP